MGKTVNTPKFRVSFPNVFKPRLNELNNKNEFSVVALFPKGADLTILKQLAHQAVVDKWGPDNTKWPDKLKSPFRDQAERAKLVNGEKVLPQGYEAGAIFITLKSKDKPGVVDQDVQRIIDESQFYAGCWAIASVRAFTYDQKGNRGVSFGLGNIQKISDGEPLGSRTAPEADFAPVENAGAASGGSATDLFG